MSFLDDFDDNGKVPISLRQLLRLFMSHKSPRLIIRRMMRDVYTQLRE